MSAIATTTLRLGTRGSRLALVQTGLVADRLRAAGVAVETVTIETEGDRRAADTPWGEGAFVTAIERALLDGNIDVAVHSAKDVPTDEDPRLTIAAFLPREQAEDVLVLPEGGVATSLDDIPLGIRVGTDSPRRTAFLRAARPDLRLHPLHGNVDTRLRRLDSGETDVLVLAAAGLRRLGLQRRITLTLDPALVPPAPGQGALAVQVRAGDPAAAVVETVDDPATRRAVMAERALLASAGGGCRAPLGVHAMVEGLELRLRAGVATPDGAVAAHLDTRVVGDDVGPVLQRLAERAMAAAAARGRPRVVVTREPGSSAATVLALVDRGYAPMVVPAIAVRPMIDDRADAADVLERLRTADWIVVTSAAPVRILAGLGERTGRPLSDIGARWAAVGAATANALRAAGVEAAFSPSRSLGAAMAAELPIAPGDLVILPRGELADDVLPTTLRARGARVETMIVYRTEQAPSTSVPAAADALAGPTPVAVIAASPSAVRGWLALADAAGAAAAEVARTIGLVAIGPTTAAAVHAAGLPLIAQAADSTPGAVADALLAALPPHHRIEDQP